TLPDASTLGPYLERLRTLLSTTCGLNDTAVAGLDATFLEQLAYELAAGRTEKNLVASGLCGDGQLVPPENQRFISFNFNGKVTAAGRPDIGVGGVRVRIVARELNEVLCDMVTLDDGRYGCGRGQYASAYASLPSVTLEYIVSGRGPERTATVVLPTPTPDSNITLARDFEATVAAMLDVRGRVKDIAGVPANRALVRFELPFPATVRTNAQGEFQHYIALPDGLRGGTLRLKAVSEEGAYSGSASASFDIAGAGIHPLTLNLDLGNEPGTLPPLYLVPHVNITGTLRNLLVQQAYGQAAPILGTVVRVRQKGAPESLCTTTVSDAAGKWDCGFIVPRGHTGPLLLEVVADGLPSATRELSLAQNEFPGPGQVVVRTLNLTATPTTLVLEGRATRPDSTGLGHVEVRFQALDGTQRTVRTATDGTYRAFLSFPHETAFSGPVAAVARVLGTEDVGVLEVRATDVTQVPAGTLKPLTRDFLFATGTAVLAGRVLNALAEDAPVAGALVRVSTSGRVLCEAETGSKGLYTCNVSSEGGGTLPLMYEVSRRGVGAFTDFEGQPAMLDLSTVPPATVRPVLPTRDLRVSPTTVRVRGVVKDSAGVAVAGAVVGASIHAETVYTPTTVYSAVDGSFTLSVPLDEGRLSGVVHVSASLPLSNGALTGHVERTFQASALHTQVDVPVTLGLNGFLPPGSTSGARLRFTGRVLNGHLAASPIGSARVDIRLGVGGPRVCSVVTSSSGDYDCPALLVPAPLSPADFEYTVHVAGASGSAPVVRGWNFTRSADVETGLRLDLVAKPTTLELRGRVTSDGTSPLANVQVSVMGSGFGTAWTNAQGEYQLVTVLPPSATTFEGTLTATLNGLSSSRAVSGALEAGQLTQRIENLTLSQRRLRLRGTVENTLAPGTQVREAQVELRHDGTPFCITRLLPIARGASEYEFTCPTELVLGDASATTLEWTTRNVHGRRSGTVTLGAQDIPAAGQQAEKRVTLGLAATALAVSGTVRDLQGRPVGGAEVVTAAVGSRTRSLTAPDGTYAVALTLPDTLADSTNGQPAADLAVEVRAGAQVGTLGGLVVVTPGQRTAVVRDMSFTAVTGLSFTGKVVNANADNQPVRNARIRILRDGMDPVLGLLCEAEMNRLPKNLDEYSCQRMLYGEALTSLTVRYQVLYQGTPVGPDIVKTYTVQPGGTLNTLTEQLSATPTTVRVTGTVKDAQGTPMASASVKLQSGQGAAVTTNAQGQYTHVLTLPTGMTHFEDTLVATRESNVTQAPLSVSPLQQWVVNAAQVDLTMQERRIQFRGRISNTFAPMSSLPDLRVRLRVDGALFCEATTYANADGTQNYDCYNQPLIRTTSEAVNVAWEVVGPWGTTTGTRAVAAAELPASGRTAVLQLDGTVSATTLEVSGVVSRGGAPLSGAKVALRRGSSFFDQVQTTTDDTGRYVIALSYTGQQATEYTAHVSATDTVNDVRVSLSGTLSAGARTQVTRELVIPSTQTGVAAWARSGFGNSSARQSAPPVLGGDAVIVPSTWAINALRVSDGSTLWTAYLGYSTFVRSEIVVDALDNVYVGTDKGTVHSFGPTGTPRWTVSELGYIGALAVGEGVLYVGSGNRVDALRLSDGSRLWTAATRGFVEELILAPEGTLLASTNGYFSGSLDALSSKDGASRWFLQTWGSPAPTPDEHLLTMASDALVKRDLNGAEVWRTPLGEQPRSAAVAADGTAFVALQRELVKVSAAGEVLGRVQVVGPEGSLDASAPVLGSDGTVYIGARLSTPMSGGDTALYAFGPDLSPRWSSWSNTGSFAVPTVVNGRVVVEQGTRVVALDTGVAGGMASGGWARMYGDARNTSRAPASSVPRRELVLSGVVGNANKGSSASMPLANVEVELSLASDGRVLMRTQSDEQGRYRLSLVTTDVDPLELRVTARGWGTSSDSLPVSFGAGVAGSVAEQTRELLLPVTTLEVRGTVRSGGTPVVDAPVWLEDSSGTVPEWNYRARTDAGGNYVYHLLYDASVAATDSIEFYAEKVSLGLGSARREVTFVHGALTPVTMDLELRNQPQHWSRTIPSAECEHADRTAYEWFAPVAGNGGDIYLRLYCTDPSTNGWYWTFARVSGDGAQVTLATWGGLPYRFFEVPTTPVLDEEGRLYVGGSRLVVLTPELRVLGEYSPPVKSPYVARPAVAMEPDGSVRLVVPVAINTNPVASGAVMSLDFTPLTGAFTPLWSEAIPERPATDALAVFSSDKEVVYVAARGVVRAFAVAPEETPRVRFTQALAVAHSYWTNSYVTVVPTPEGDQLRHMLSYHDGVTSLTSSGTVMQGWPFTGARPRPVAPAVAPDGTTYFIDDNDGTLWALNADGTVRWKFLPPLWDELEWGVTRDERTGRLYVSSYWAVYAVDDMGPAPFLAWTHYEIEDWVVGAPLVTPSGVFVTTGYNVLRAFEH
ncbi:MAG TPA: hypothetical protein VEY88_20405, partial [Archangium sp.]|nr:hypothetical protein [Archangium sp.]